MRTFKDPNTDGKETSLTHILGEEQARWLIKEVSRSKATWKVISADLPLGIIVPDGPVNQESLANRDAGAPLGKELEIAGVLSAFKRNRVKNVVWLTADVHYCAAHHYSPERAAFTDFDPFWEFVAGPINAGTFGPSQMDGTFGPEVAFFTRPAPTPTSPRAPAKTSSSATWTSTRMTSSPSASATPTAPCSGARPCIRSAHERKLGARKRRD